MEEQFIGNYRILEKIGAGGMARVYLAVHKDIPNLKVVLKILSDPRMADRFRQEADKLALLDEHPNICRIRHFFNHGDDLVIAMDFIDGQTLEDILKEKKTLPIDEALRITIAVLSILEVAHEKDIFHRDIKPSNVMIDKRGNIKIIDFGIAKGKSDPSLTIAGTAAGTPAYMAPEQFTPDENVDYAKVDIYAAGSTLYKIITGELPFKGDNEFALRDAKLFNEPTPPGKLNRDIPGELDGIIMKSLAKEPEQRFNSAGEMKSILMQVLSGISPATMEQIKKERVHIPNPPSKKSKVPLILFAGVVVIAAVIAVILLWPSEPEKTEIIPDEPIDTAGFVEDMAGTGSLVLSVTPSGDVYIDETPVGSAVGDTTLKIDPGIHTVRVVNEMAVNKTIFDTISLVEGEVLPRRYAFEMPSTKIEEPEPPKDYGKVSVGSRPRGADIYIDGKLQDEQTPFRFTLETGRHIIKLVLSSGGEIYEHVDTVNITKDGEEKVLFEP